MTWRVRLIGSEGDLVELERAVHSSSALRLEKIGDQWALTGSEIDSAPDALTAWRRAQECFPLILAGAILTDGRSRLVEVVGHVTDDDGNQTVFAQAAIALASAVAHAVGTVTDAQGNHVPAVRNRTHAEVMLDLPVPDVREVALLLSGERSPSDLYKVFEIIRHERGRDLVELGWATKAEQSRFTNSVNNPAALGGAARHARLNSSPPKEPMTVRDARIFIEAQVRRWVHDLAMEHGVPLTEA